MYFQNHKIEKEPKVNDLACTVYSILDDSKSNQNSSHIPVVRPLSGDCQSVEENQEQC